jgi:hypothetical protein
MSARTIRPGALVAMTTLLGVLGATRRARAGDQEAHTAAAMEAQKQVATSSGTKGIGDLSIQFAPVTGSVADWVNKPDMLGCDDPQQPPMLNRSNNCSFRGQLDGGAADFTLRNWGLDSAAMLCNWSHFSRNTLAADPLPDAGEAYGYYHAWAKEILDAITRPTSGAPTQSSAGCPPVEDPPSTVSRYEFPWPDHPAGSVGIAPAGAFCGQVTFSRYWERVWKSLHFVQDQAAPFHAQGNMYCTPWMSSPSELQACYTALGHRIRSVVGAIQVAPTLACDESFATTTGTPTVTGLQLLGLCFGKYLTLFTRLPTPVPLFPFNVPSSPAACAGLERVLYHHCGLDQAPAGFYAGDPANWPCAGKGNVNAPNFCEGQTKSAIDASYVARATAASLPILQAAVQDWQGVCHSPDFDDSCTDPACAVWCQRSTFLRPDSIKAGRVVTGSCVGEDKSCADKHPTCVCFIGSGPPGGSPDHARGDNGDFSTLLAADVDSFRTAAPVDPLAEKSRACAFVTVGGPTLGLPQTACPDAVGLPATPAGCNPTNRFCEACGQSEQPCCPVGSNSPGCDTRSDASNQCFDQDQSPIPAPPNVCDSWKNTRCDACQNACPTGQSCCATGPGPTSASCVDVQSDPANCGACGNVCVTGPCMAGRCSDRPSSGMPAPSPSAFSWGDPHDSTWDGVHFDFQYAGEFLLVTDQADFSVQVRQEPILGGAPVAVVTAVAAKVAANRVEIYAGPPTVLKVNGVSSGSTSLPGGGSASITGIVWPDGTQLSVVSDGPPMSLSFSRTPSSSSLPLRGVFGSQDGVAVNDLMSRDGAKTFTLPLTSGDFANSWRITMAESLFTYAPGSDTTTFTDLAFPRTTATSSALNPVDYDAARQVCVAAGVTNFAILEDCILDVALTGDASYAQRAAAVRPSSPHGEIASVTASPDSGQVDRVGVDDGDLAPDGVMDVVITAQVQGPVYGFVVIPAAGGNSPLAIPCDTVVGAQRVYPSTDPTQYWLGSATDGLAVYEGGRLLNGADGSMPMLMPGPHTLTLEFEDVDALAIAGGSAVPLNHNWLVSALQTDGTLDAGLAVTVP